MMNRLLDKHKIVYLFMLVTSIIMLINSYISSIATAKYHDVLGPTLLPRVVLILLITFIVILIFRKETESGRDSEFFIKVKQIPYYLLFIVFNILLILSVRSLGLYVSLFLFLAITMYFLGFKQKIYLLLISIIGSALIFQLFKMANIYIPENVLLF